MQFKLDTFYTSAAIVGILCTIFKYTPIGNDGIFLAAFKRSCDFIQITSNQGCIFFPKIEFFIKRYFNVLSFL